MRRLALNLSKSFVTQGLITESDIEIYRYGLEMLISSTFTSLSVIILACFLDSLEYGFLYLLITIPLRVTAGGYHANTFQRCFIISNLLYATLSFILRLLHTNCTNIYLWLFTLYLSAIYIYLKSPVQNEHQPLDTDTIKRNKKHVTIYLILDCIIINTLMFIPSTSHIAHFATLSISIVALLILPTQKGGEQT